jgi:hypothetical protein
MRLGHGHRLWAEEGSDEKPRRNRWNDISRTQNVIFDNGRTDW